MALNEQVIKVLIIDDDEDDFFITSDYMKGIEEYKLKIDWSYKFNEAVQLLEKRGYDIYFVDYRLGAKTGLDFLREAVRIGAEEPIVLLTGKGNKTVDVEAMQMGATDYLIKTELTTEKLERCIRYSLERTDYLKALRANEMKYRSIFELSKDAVFISDKALRFRDCNPATSTLLGYAKDELKKLSLYDLIEDEADRTALQARLESDGQIADIEVEIKTKEGDKRSCVFSMTATAEKEENYFQGLIHDITNLRRAEKANLMVEKLGATGRLVRTLAHEVRNPLNNINMSVEQLSHTGTENEENTLFLDIIQRNSKRIGDIITELLDTARPTELTFDQHSLQEIMDDARNEALDRITLQQINLQVRYQSTPCMIMANREKLRIAFLNIIINAVEAMEPGKGILTVTVETQKGMHVATIRDTGCGIPEENISRLFEPYFTSKRNGMGLGLAATLNILQSHRANIDVSSVLKQGTTFTISFPSAS
jgi:PAS domain S-box-containing protein